MNDASMICQVTNVNLVHRCCMVMVCLGVRTDYMVLSRSPTRVEITGSAAVNLSALV